jgi:hypothetical protein
MLSTKIYLLAKTISCLTLISCGSQDFNRAEPPIQNNSSLTGNDSEVAKSTSAIEDVLVRDDQQSMGSIEFKIPPKACSEKVVDFDLTPEGKSIASGKRVLDQYRSWGIRIEAQNNRSKLEDVAITFDSANPTGKDTDLATPGYGPGNSVALHNLLIIPEYLTDNNGDGLVDDPNDSSKGGVIIFHFDQPTEIQSIDMIDIEGKKTSIKLYDAATEVIRTDVPSRGDNSVQTIRWEKKPKVVKLKVLLEGSGAVDNLRICLGGETNK